MPIMTRMRDSMPTILFALLIAFVITLVFDWGMDYMGIRARGSDIIGTINDKEISFREFADLVKEYTDNQKAQTGNELDERQLKQARDQVWQSLINRHLIEEQITRLGLSVSDEELHEWVWGDNPPDDLRQNFVDSTGQFRRDLYEQFLDDPGQFLKDPQGVDQKFGEKWLANYREYLRQRLAQEKLQSVVSATVKVTEGDVLQKFLDQTLQHEFLYVLFDANRLVPDSLVEPTDEDIRAHYNDHLDQQKVDATRKVKFVQLREVPSTSDTQEVQSQMEGLARRARNGEDFLALVAANDENPDSGSYFNRGELTPGLEAAAFGASQGSIVGPLLEPDGFHLLQVLDQRKSERNFVHASHILFLTDAGTDSTQVLKTVRDVDRRARSGEDFAALARQYSGDPASAEKGGDLGWFGRGRMVKAFEDAAFGASPGRIVGPVRSQFGWHIIKVHHREAREIKVVDLLVPIRPSSQTKNDIFDRAADLTHIARDGDFTKEASAAGLEIREATIKEKTSSIPGIGAHEQAIRWAFANDVGDVSDPFAVSNSFVVFSITESRDAGIRPFDEAKESLKPTVRRALKVKRTMAIAAEYRSRLSDTDSLTALRKFNGQLNVQKAGPIALSASIPGVGREQNFLGALSGLPTGKISNPVESTRGAYLVQLLSRSAFDSTAFTAQKSGLRAQILQERKGKVFNDWVNNLKEAADIEDNRDIFFR